MDEAELLAPISTPQHLGTADVARLDPRLLLVRSVVFMLRLAGPGRTGLEYLQDR